MQKDNRSQDQWYKIRLENPELTNGSGLLSFLRSSIPKESLPAAVILAGVEGAGNPELGITQLGCVLISTMELEDRLLSTGQIDWANLYFFEAANDELRGRVCDGLSLVEAIAESKLSIRVIDDSCIDFFTRRHDLINDLRNRYPSALLQFSRLAEMDYPQ